MAHATDYTFIQIEVPNILSGGINCYGNISGTYITGSTPPDPPNLFRHGFLLEADGSFTPIDFPGASGTSAIGINDSGYIVGNYIDTAGYGDKGFMAFSSPPSSPINVQASDGTYTDKVRVSWTASLGTTSYFVGWLNKRPK